MERVIMLKWFKKLTNRFFSEEVEEEAKNESKDEINQLEEIKEDQEHPATFRFPIITDAEIYGWSEEEQVQSTETEKENVFKEDEFEPIPLYENERWPGDRPERQRYEEQQLSRYIERPAFQRREEKKVAESEYLKRTEKSKVLQADLKDMQNKKRRQKFIPSQVPSPIYGYSKPQKSIPKKEESSKISEEHGELENTTSPTVEQVEQKNNLVKESIEQERDEQRIIEEEPITEMESSPIVEASEEVLEVEITAEEDNVIESEDKSTFNNLATLEEVNVREEPLVEVEEERVDAEEIQDEDDEYVMGISESMADSVEVNEPVESHDYEDTDQQNENEQVQNQEVAIREEPQEKPTMTNDEKVVPFNVLMLKSDKRNLQKREIVKKIASELEAKQQLAIEKNTKNSSTAEMEIEHEEHNQVLEESRETSQDVEEIEDREAVQSYVLPKLEYLIPPETEVEDTDWLIAQSARLEESLSHFGIQAEVINAVQGPTVTRFELTVSQGTKVSRVRNLTDDLKLTLAARDIRIEAPIPGRSSIGIEIPNRTARAVRISEVIQTESFQHSESPLEAVLGLGLTGEPATLDLRKMPHGMIAGATGSGKSVCINSILVSLLYKASPSDLQMMLIDPKMVELAPFNGIPHLISPVITDVKAATAALKWAVAEMERRYELLAHAGVRDIERYNKKVIENRKFSKKMPYLLIVIDELADLMMMAPADVEVSISRITQKARACGIHLIIATQRPSVDVITGIIKANIPTRIAFSVSSQVDSRTMIDTNGAERLLGKGDMLYIGNGESVPIRLQGTFVTDDEIERIIEHVQGEASPTYLFGQNELLQSATEEEADPLFNEVCKYIYNQGSASTSMLQRKFSIGYNRAAKLMDRLEELAFVSPQQGSKARDVYLTKEELQQLTEKIL